MTTGISLCSNTHKKIPVMNTGSLQWEQEGFPVMKTGFSLWELLHRENPVLALYWIAVWDKHCNRTMTMTGKPRYIAPPLLSNFYTVLTWCLHPLELICSFYKLALNILFCSIYFIGQTEWSRNGIPFEYFMLCSVFSFPEVEDMVISCTLTPYLFALDFCNPVWNIEFDELDFFLVSSWFFCLL